LELTGRLDAADRAPLIEVEFERGTQQIIGPGRGHGLRFGDGSELMADLVARPIATRC
jgi:NAD(P)H-nitrite reductase large subunit